MEGRLVARSSPWRYLLLLAVSLGVPADVVLARVRSGIGPSLAAREQVRQNPPA